MAKTAVVACCLLACLLRASFMGKRVSSYIVSNKRRLTGQGVIISCVGYFSTCWGFYYTSGIYCALGIYYVSGILLRVGGFTTRGIFYYVSV